MTLQPRPGFLWCNVRWGAPDDLVSDKCSYCGAPLDEDGVPFRCWDDEGWACVFCETCMQEWWGFTLAPRERDWL